MIAATLFGSLFASRFLRLRELQVSEQRERGRATDFPPVASRSDAPAVLPRLFPEFWFHALRAAERSLLPDPVSPRLLSEPRPPPNQAMQPTALRRHVFHVHLS